MPDLDFTVAGAEALPFAAVPTIRFTLQLRDTTGVEHIQSILLRVQIRIEATQRHYATDEEGRLLELFGEPRQWGDTLRSLLWTHVTAHVQGFAGHTVAELPVACTYDFEVASAKYFHALQSGEVPLLFLFSGTIFTTTDDGCVRIAQIPWEKEATFRMPVSVWKQTMDQYFPNSAWLRLRKDVFDRLSRYKAQAALPTWEQALDQLLQVPEAEVEQ